ncbi:MAG: gamma carbonic anhydrase family protein [Candidatus Hodarchaeota archaeon]
MPIVSIKKKDKVVEPEIDPTAWISKHAVVVGNVKIGPGTVVYQGAIIRGDFAAVKIGANNVIQDDAVINTADGFKTKIGDNNLIGFKAIVHGATVGNNAVVGIGSTIMIGAKIGDDALIGAGAFIGNNKVVPPGKFWIGTPAVEKGDNKQGAMWEIGRKSWRENVTKRFKETEA